MRHQRDFIVRLKKRVVQYLKFDLETAKGDTENVKDTSWIDKVSNDDEGTHIDMSGGLGVGKNSKLHAYTKHSLETLYNCLAKFAFDFRVGVEYGCHISENFTNIHKLFLDLDFFYEGTWTNAHTSWLLEPFHSLIIDMFEVPSEILVCQVEDEIGAHNKNRGGFHVYVANIFVKHSDYLKFCALLKKKMNDDLTLEHNGVQIIASGIGKIVDPVKKIRLICSKKEIWGCSKKMLGHEECKRGECKIRQTPRVYYPKCLYRLDTNNSITKLEARLQRYCDAMLPGEDDSVLLLNRRDLLKLTSMREMGDRTPTAFSESFDFPEGLDSQTDDDSKTKASEMREIKDEEILDMIKRAIVCCLAPQITLDNYDTMIGKITQNKQKSLTLIEANHTLCPFHGHGFHEHGSNRAFYELIDGFLILRHYDGQESVEDPEACFNKRILFRINNNSFWVKLSGRAPIGRLKKRTYTNMCGRQENRLLTVSKSVIEQHRIECDASVSIRDLRERYLYDVV